MEDKSSLFHTLLYHGLQFRVTRLVQNNSGKQVVDQAQEEWFILVDLRNDKHKGKTVEHQINTFQIATFMYCYHNNLLPPLFFNLFFTNSQIHGYSTRTPNNYRVHHCRTNLKKFTILYQGPKIWNSLPVTITSL